MIAGHRAAAGAGPVAVLVATAVVRLGMPAAALATEPETGAEVSPVSAVSPTATATGGIARRRRSVTEEDRHRPPVLEFSLELASAYVFRGYNVFQADNQRDQRWVERPRFVWSPAGTGLSLGYSSANQVTGDNLSSNVASGLGAEQDLFAGYDFRRGAPVGLSAELALVAYPLADDKVTGTGTPFFVSLAAEPTYRHVLFFYAGYLRGLRRGPVGEDQVYLNPRVEQVFDLGDRLELDLELGAGVKLRQRDVTEVRDNMFDVLGTAAIYCALNEVFYVGAKVGWAWTNFTSERDPESGQVIHPRFSDEYVPFWALSVGAEFANGVSGRPAVRRRRVRAM